MECCSRNVFFKTQKSVLANPEIFLKGVGVEHEKWDWSAGSVAFTIQYLFYWMYVNTYKIKNTTVEFTLQVSQESECNIYFHSSSHGQNARSFPSCGLWTAAWDNDFYLMNFKKLWESYRVILILNLLFISIYNILFQNIYFKNPWFQCYGIVELLLMIIITRCFW